MYNFYKEVGGLQGSKANMVCECESTLKVCLRYCVFVCLILQLFSKFLFRSLWLIWWQQEKPVALFVQMKDPVFTLFFQLITWAISDSTHNILPDMSYGHWLRTSLSLYDRKDLGKSKKQKVVLCSLENGKPGPSVVRERNKASRHKWGGE